MAYYWKKLSVVIPAYNEENRLSLSLQNLCGKIGQFSLILK